MAIFETDSQPESIITTRQRWSHYFVIALGVLSAMLLFNLRQNALSATSVYQNIEEGIVSYYPANWLIDEDGAYVFQVRNMREIGFKTTFRVSVRTVSSQTTVRTLFDSLTMERAQSLTAYRTLSIEPFDGLEDREASAANYQYVATDPNPFQESVPIVVRGIDILTTNRDQAIIITMLSEADKFDQNFVLFRRFIDQLQF